jgi:hypothetical protein
VHNALPKSSGELKVCVNLLEMKIGWILSVWLVSSSVWTVSAVWHNCEVPLQHFEEWSNKGQKGENSHMRAYSEKLQAYISYRV